MGSQLSSSDLILVGLIIHFVLTGAVLDVEWTSFPSISLNVQTVPHLSESDLHLELCSSYYSGMNSGRCGLKRFHLSRHFNILIMYNPS